MTSHSMKRLLWVKRILLKNVCVCVCVCVCSVPQLCQTFCDFLDCRPPGSSVYGILQARILEWVTILFSRGSSQPRDQTHVSCSAGRFLTTEPSGKPIYIHTYIHTYIYIYTHTHTHIYAYICKIRLKIIYYLFIIFYDFYNQGWGKEP